MRALILDNRVVDVCENEFEVHDSMFWVECDETVKTGFVYENGLFNEYVPQELTYTYAQYRRLEYPNIRDFADAFYWLQEGDSTKMDEYVAKIKEIKSKYPKPESM